MVDPIDELREKYPGFVFLCPQLGRAEKVVNPSIETVVNNAEESMHISLEANQEGKKTMKDIFPDFDLEAYEFISYHFTSIDRTEESLLSFSPRKGQGYEVGKVKRGDELFYQFKTEDSPVLVFKKEELENSNTTKKITASMAVHLLEGAEAYLREEVPEYFRLQVCSR